jgi:uncharacterized protein
VIRALPRDVQELGGAGNTHLRIAVVGAGISGLGAAWLLSTRHDVTVFEAERRLGGHANTVDINDGGSAVAIDTGFIVYNLASYPNLIALFDRLNVPTAATDMGFAVSFGVGRYEYCGSGLAGLIGNPGNLASPAHWRMMADLFRFFREARATATAELANDVSLGDWLRQRSYSDRFIHAHIVPMAAAIWSTPAADILQFPFAAFARFFDNHGLLQAYDRPPWRTVRGGSREYVARIVADTRAAFRSTQAVTAVRPDGEAVRVVLADGSAERFDAVVMACQGDQACRITAGADDAVTTVLSAFQYSDNEAVLHTDASLMPRRRRLWASWNYLNTASVTNRERDASLSVTYWMNKLQPLPVKSDYFVTLNPSRPIADAAVRHRVAYRHPMFDERALAAQRRMWPLQGRNNIWYAGSYLGYGFHEDGLQAGLAAAEDLSLRAGGENGRVRRPWDWDPGKGRIFTGSGERAALEKEPA